MDHICGFYVKLSLSLISQFFKILQSLQINSNEIYLFISIKNQIISKNLVYRYPLILITLSGLETRLVGMEKGIIGARFSSVCCVRYLHCNGADSNVSTTSYLRLYIPARRTANAIYS